MKDIYFLNLSNGIEFFPFIDNPHFIRIQSTACEQKLWDQVLMTLDNDFLWHLANGYNCIIVDFSERKNETRALYQGLEFIKYVINLLWFNQEITPLVHTVNCLSYFRQCYKDLDRNTKRKIKYFKKYINTTHINISKLTGNLYDFRNGILPKLITD